MSGKKTMKVSIDGGGLCAQTSTKFGNYTFTKNIIQALLKYDQRNYYSIYSFCTIPFDLQLSSYWKYKILLPTRLWMKVRVSIEEYLDRKDIFLGLNQAIPLFTKAKVISFSHGLSYYYFPHLYRESYARLTTQLVPMVKNSQYIVVSSEKVKAEMKEAYPWYKHVVSIPYGIPFDMSYDTSAVRSYNAREGKYFLFVGMSHPIKNIRFLVNSFLKFRSLKKYKNFRLILVGPREIKNSSKNGIQVIQEICREDLKKLYGGAASYLTASLYESFNLPVLEALSQNCPVIGLSSAIIPEFQPYVTHIKHKDDFVRSMIEAAEGNAKNIDVKRIHKTFSWERYVKKLLQLYK